MSFLPEDYKEPVTSNYMRLEQGENTFRVLSDAIVGMEYWKTDKEGNRRPIRKRPEEKIEMDDLEVNPKTGELEMPRHFWAFVVYNCEAEKIQILEITQQTVRKAINALIRNKKWGDPKNYDITVTKEGQGFDTDYQTTPNPKEKLDPGIVKIYEAMKINLEALFSNDDPFASVSPKESEEAEELAEEVAQKI